MIKTRKAILKFSIDFYVGLGLGFCLGITLGLGFTNPLLLIYLPPIVYITVIYIGYISENNKQNKN